MVLFPSGYFMSKSNKKISTLISNRYEDDYGQLRTNFLYPLQRLFERVFEIFS